MCFNSFRSNQKFIWQKIKIFIILNTIYINYTKPCWAAAVGAGAHVQDDDEELYCKREEWEQKKVDFQ